MNYTYDNGMVSKWMSEDKRDIPDDLTENDGQPVFLLMKQAISTGWDCPRAKFWLNFVKEKMKILKYKRLVVYVECRKQGIMKMMY